VAGEVVWCDDLGCVRSGRIGVGTPAQTGTARQPALYPLIPPCEAFIPPKSPHTPPKRSRFPRPPLVLCPSGMHHA